RFRPAGTGAATRRSPGTDLADQRTTLGGAFRPLDSRRHCDVPSCTGAGGRHGSLGQAVRGAAQYSTRGLWAVFDRPSVRGLGRQECARSARCCNVRDFGGGVIFLFKVGPVTTPHTCKPKNVDARHGAGHDAKIVAIIAQWSQPYPSENSLVVLSWLVQARWAAQCSMAGWRAD